MYAPHTLLVKRKTQVRDEYNRTLSVDYEWVKVGACRCDDSDTSNLVDDAGNAFIPKYHIVSERNDIKAGDYIKVLNGDSLRGEGEVRRVMKTNFLNYMSIYV